MTTQTSDRPLSYLDERANAAFISWEESRRRLLSMQASVIAARRSGLKPPHSSGELGSLRAESKALLSIAAATMRERAMETSLSHTFRERVAGL